MISNNGLNGSIVREHLRTVIMIGSSSRGGSSITAEYLRQRDDLLHLRAEINPFLHKCLLTHPHSETGSDRLTAAHARSAMALWDWLATDIGNYHRGPLNEQDWALFARHLHFRLRIQWPLLSISMDDIEGAVGNSVAWLQKNHAWGECFQDVVQFHCQFLRHLRESHPSLDPRWYDLSSNDLHMHFPDLPTLEEPGVILEEPPFVLISPWRPASLEDLQEKPLVIKTPSNAYRLPFYRSFFEKKELKLMHLKREAAEAINGLIDGWNYSRGFHSHRLGKLLWKYDLPPGWEEFRDQRIEEIARFQWLSSH